MRLSLPSIHRNFCIFWNRDSVPTKHLSPHPFPQLLTCTICFLSLWIWHINRIIYLSFCVWLISLSILSLRVHPCCNRYQNLLPFLRLGNIPVCGWTTFCHHSPVEGPMAVPTCRLLWECTWGCGHLSPCFQFHGVGTQRWDCQGI